MAATATSPAQTLPIITTDSDVQTLYTRLEKGVNLIAEARADFRPASRITKLLTLWHDVYQEYRAAVATLPAEMQMPWRYKGRNLKIMVMFDARPVADNTSDRGAI